LRGILQGKSRNGGGGEQGRASGYILNITDEIIPTVTPSAILLVSMSCHCTICLFKSRCNSVGNCICKKLHVITLFACVIFFISIVIFLVYTDDIFLLIFINRVSDEKIQSVKIIVKY